MRTNTGAHAPNNFSNYERIHETVLNQFRESDFIGRETLKFSPWQRYYDDLSIPQIRLYGEIACRGKIVIRVEKYLDILENSDNNPLVQTVSYAYNASVQGFGNIFRYDNLDDYFVSNNGHMDEHHKHNFNWVTGQQDWGGLVWVGYDNWPTLGQFIAELQIWYWENRGELAQHLDDPDSYPKLGLGY